MELQLLGPTLTITGVLFVLLRILFCSVPGCVDVSDDTSHHIEANVIDVIEKSVLQLTRMLSQPSGSPVCWEVESDS